MTYHPHYCRRSALSTQSFSAAAITAAIAGTALLLYVVLYGGPPAFATARATAFATAGTTAPTLTNDRAQAAATWLAGRLRDVNNQPSPNGDHLADMEGGVYSFSATTLNVVWALAATGEGSAKAAQVLDYVAEKQAFDYGNYGNGFGPGLFTGAIGKLALSTIVAGRDPRRYVMVDPRTRTATTHDLISELQRNVCTGHEPGDFVTIPDCAASGAGTNVFTSIGQSLITLALVRSGATPAPSQVNFLLSLQCPDGGFRSGDQLSAPCVDDTDSTSYAIMALHALRQTAATSRAADWLTSRRAAGGYWTDQRVGNRGATGSTGLATAALSALGRDMRTSRDWLLQQQVTTGPTFGPTASRGALKDGAIFAAGSATNATADGVLGLPHSASLETISLAGASSTLAVLPLTGASSRSSVPQGGAVTVTAGGFTAGENVLGALHSTPFPLGAVHANSFGSVQLSLTVPATVAAGIHTVTLTGASSGLVATIPLTVTAAPQNARSPATPAGVNGGNPEVLGTTPVLAATGGRVDRRNASVGVVLLLAGISLQLAGRRRSP